MLPTIAWKEGTIVMIDQRKLPAEEVYVTCRSYQDVAEAIEKMVIRGAPAIGVAAAYGLALGLWTLKQSEDRQAAFNRIFLRLEKTRPTAVNLFWALKRMKRVFEENMDISFERLKQRMLDEALSIEREDIETNKKIGIWGEGLIHDGQIILTHCNAGALATAGFGTALGVIRAAFSKGKKIRVFADETRPFLQGARLTCWELNRDGIPVVLITDNMAGYLMLKGEIDAVITGADRIAANGDTANKIGTYTVAVLAKEHNIPFYVAAPLSTVDFDKTDGSGIPIEEREPEEVRKIGGSCLTVPGIDVRNPAFDVTPARFITAIVTEKGVAYPPYKKNLRYS
ncbi:MAG: S-methyl-5-thioribose-1-phosphate isomerase [Candidatus Aminicenantes bacterium]|nr:S-methyl-5-thioribose-1-phosphate isomerase [Candidatus Aminicenantes bacterium]